MSAGGSALTLLVPGLAGPADPGTGNPDEAARVLADDLALGGFARLLARAGRLGSPHDSPDASGLLFEALGVARPRDGDWPAGALSRLAVTGEASAGVWIRADPVYLRPDPARLILMQPASLDLGIEEARAIAAWLNDHEHAPGPALEVLRADAWVARLDTVPRLRTTAPGAAHGDDADHHLPAGADAGAWHARMNEIQMLLHQCPVNAERERAGRPPVNSLWFWGAGALAAPPATHFEVLHGGGDLARGLAAWSGAAAEPVPADAASWLAGGPAGRRLLLLTDLHTPARDVDTGAWRDAAVRVDAEWLAPLARALLRGQLARVEVHAGRGAGLAVSRREAMRLWRRPPSPGRALAGFRRAAASAPSPSRAGGAA